MKNTIKQAIMTMFILAVFAAGFYSATFLQHSTIATNVNKHDVNKHDAHSQPDAVTIPRQAGQGAFAAIAEIVAMLEADKDTDWSKVNITRLRDHLIDMNALTLKASVAINDIADGKEFIVTGDGETLKAIQTMVPAHAVELDKMPSWQADTQMLANGVKLSMTSTDKNVVAKINGLGFFGLMATGSHHQPHHLGMAKGTMAH